MISHDTALSLWRYLLVKMAPYLHYDVIDVSDCAYILLNIFVRFTSIIFSDLSQVLFLCTIGMISALVSILRSIGSLVLTLGWL